MPALRAERAKSAREPRARMDKTRKLSAVLSDDELFKQKALEYFTAADQNESGTLSDEEVLEVRPDPAWPNTVQSVRLTDARVDDAR